MTEKQAYAWLKQVEGTIYRNGPPDEERSWVAVVETPPLNGGLGKIIMAFGGSVESATGTAEEQWDQIWSRISSVH